MKENLASRVLTISLYAIFALGILGTATLPFMIDYYTKFFYDAYFLEAGYRTFLLIFLTAVAIPGLWIVLEMILMMRSIPQGPFIKRNVTALNRIAVILLVISALFFAKLFFYTTFLTMACGFLFVVFGFFGFTLSSLFKQAVHYKEENDLTI
ncbi:MAG: DUF2975 domain-containing protein [Oscillospiraceae bacterium]|nr:DUF2975 domain-containing protein [Oscillospiraceae bacterium]